MFNLVKKRCFTLKIPKKCYKNLFTFTALNLLTNFIPDHNYYISM